MPRMWRQVRTYIPTSRRSKLLIRIFVLLVVLSSLTQVAIGQQTSSVLDLNEDVRESSTRPYSDRQPIAPPADGVTVITGHAFEESWSGITAYDETGRLLYFNDTYDGYADVDPSPAGKRTVVYTAADRTPGETIQEICQNSDYYSPPEDCSRVVIERLNLTTGETTVLYSKIIPRDRSSLWHDVDRLNEHEFVVADIYADRVFVLNVTSELVTWSWNAQSELPLTSGRNYPDDWTHVNDVEVLPDGRFMVSLRNQDQIVFLSREHGLQENWTLGADDEYDILYEQHNPDYIPERRGGPAVLVADSENDRIVEYQRTNNSWRQTWVWTDERLSWPRDADRLPNGNTLITDVHGNRIFEVNQTGHVVWSVTSGSPYEAERLGTGDESSGGYSATYLNLPSVRTEPTNVSTEVNDTAGSGIDTVGDVFTTAGETFPIVRKAWHGLQFVLPKWMGLIDVLLIVVSTCTVLTWLSLELFWSDYSVSFTSPISIHRRE